MHQVNNFTRICTKKLRTAKQRIANSFCIIIPCVKSPKTTVSLPYIFANIDSCITNFKKRVDKNNESKKMAITN